MKYFLKIIGVMVLSVAIICGAFYGMHGRLPLPEATPSATATKHPATEKNGDKVKIAELGKSNIYLYKTKNGALLSVKGVQYEFTNWGNDFDALPPKIYYADFDNDKAKEIVIKAVEYKTGENEYVFRLIYLDPFKNDEGKKEYNVININRNTWLGIMDGMIKEEMSQLKSCSKIVQFAMNFASSGISYDSSGVAKTGYAGYFSALTDKNGKYLTIEKWDKGTGEYSVSADNKIFVDIPIVVSYKNSSEIQLAGKVHFKLDKRNGKIVVGERSMVFIPNSDYRVTDPRETATEPWSYTEKNSDSKLNGSSREIKLIKYRTAFDATINMQTLSYASASTDISNVSSLKLSEGSVILTAKSGCSFAESSEFSVVINEGTENQLDISYTAEIRKNAKGNETLVISFDKAYPKQEISTLSINYGAK